MPAKRKKDKKPRPKNNRQTPTSSIRPITMRGPWYYLPHAREYPFLGAWVMRGWKEGGITPVVVARQQETGNVIFAVCLIDLYCLGIKDAYGNADISLRKFQSNLPKMCSGAPKPCSIELAHEIIYGGMEYAARYGFQPHRDFTAQHCDKVLDPPEAHPRTSNVVFGKDGEPFYVSGPYDDQRKINSVLNTLRRTAGEGNFHFLIRLGESD